MKFLISGWKKVLLLMVVTVLIIGKSNAQQVNDDTVMEPKPVLVSEQFSFTEGPAADAHGNIFFTDQPNNKIWKYSTDGKLSIFKDSAGRSNGMYFDEQGNLISCADENDQLWSISPAGKVKVLVKNFNGHQLNGPNDCWVSKSGNIYFTDPYYQRDYWQRTKPDSLLGGQKVYWLPKGKNKPVVAIQNVVQPNGLAGNITGSLLYVSDIGASKIYRYNVQKDGSLSEGILFVNALADGLTVDAAGNVYLAGKGISVYSPEGNLIHHYDIPRNWTSNICIGGKNKDLLFITASEAVYTLQLQVKK